MKNDVCTHSAYNIQTVVSQYYNDKAVDHPPRHFLQLTSVGKPRISLNLRKQHFSTSRLIGLPLHFRREATGSGWGTSHAAWGSTRAGRAWRHTGANPTDSTTWLWGRQQHIGRSRSRDHRITEKPLRVWWTLLLSATILRADEHLLLRDFFLISFFRKKGVAREYWSASRLRLSSVHGDSQSSEQVTTQ